MNKKIVILGSINTDITASAERLPAKGETVNGTSVDMFGGGKGANQAIQCALLGLETCMIGMVGNDMQGDFVRKSLTDRGVDISRVLVSGQYRTGCASIYIDPNGDNMLVYAPGANHHIALSQINDNRELIASADVFISQTEVNLDAVAYGLKTAHDAGALTILNPAPAIPLPDEMFANIDYFTPNETESEFYTGILRTEMPLDEWEKRNVDWFLSRGVKNLCITMGEKGAFFSDGREYLTVPAFPVKPVDTTAAGDSFHGGLAYGLAHGLTMEKTLQLGNACGGMSTQTLGAQNSIRNMEAIRTFLEQQNVVL